MALTLLTTFIALAALSYHRQSLRTATLITAGILAVSSGLGYAGPISWAVFLVIAVPVNIPSIRQSIFSNKALSLFKGVMPEMSQTEKDAIEAGTVWWEAELFKGNPDWKFLHNIPKNSLSDEEQAFLDGPVTDVCRMINDYEVTHELADLPPEVWQYLKDNKFFAMIIKKKYGGLEFSAYAQSCDIQILSLCQMPSLIRLFKYI